MNPANPSLACSVRNCGLALLRTGKIWSCARGHSFDVARSGYVNLLQPQDRRSIDAGDSSDAVMARSRTLGWGAARSIFDSFVGRAAALPFDDGATVVDLGCGAGELLAALSRVRRIGGIGIDLSPFAVDRAAKNFPHLTWIVANADRRLPLLDESAALILSLHARRNPAESARVLTSSGRLLIGVPAADDLAELRAAIQGVADLCERGDAVVDEHKAHFTLLDRWTVRHVVDANHAQIMDLLAGTYRGMRPSQSARAATLDRMEVTLASEFLLFARGGE